jgi:photosystem II stability/assembly factor-like uncharacterized protein
MYNIFGKNSYSSSIATFTLALMFALAVLMNIALSQSWTPLNGPYRANVADFAIGRAGTTTTLYEADASRVYKTTDAAANWSITTSFNGNPVTVTCQPDNPAIVLVALEQFIRRHTNGGTGGQWTYAYPGSTSGDINFHPLTIVTSAPNSNNMFVGILKVNGNSSMRRSSNGGQNWNYVGYFFSNVRTDVYAIAPHPTDANLIFAGGTAPGQLEPGANFSESYTNGVFYSLDAGITWAHSGATGVFEYNIEALATFTSGSTTYVFAGATNAAYNLYYSTNATNGTPTWSPVATYPGGNINSIVVDANNKLYVAAQNGIYRSTNNGTSWTTLSCNGLWENNVKRLQIDPGNANTLFAGTAGKVFKSTDAGATWTDASKNITFMVAPSITASGTKYLAISNGLSAIERNINSSGWNSIGLGSTYCDQGFTGSSIRFESTAGTVAYAAGFRQENGTAASLYRTLDASSNSWTEVYASTTTIGALNGVTIDYNLVQPTPPHPYGRLLIFGKDIQNNSIFNGANQQNIAVSITNGNSWEYISLRDDEVAPEIADIASVATVPSYMYAAIKSGGTGGVWVTTNSGINWNKLIITDENNYTALGLDAGNPYYLYAARTSGLYRLQTTSQYLSWTQVRNDVVKKILPHPSYPHTLYGGTYVWVIGNNGNNVYKTTDAGLSWTDITSSLPSPIFDLQRDLTNNQYIYASTSNGVYRIDPAPEAPTNLHSVNDDPELQIHPEFSWDVSPEADLPTNKYKVYKKKGAGGWGLRGTTSTNSFTDVTETITGTGDGTTVYYYVKAIDIGGNQSSQSNTITFVVDKISSYKISETRIVQEVPTVFSLSQNYPNPFNPSTKIQFALPMDAFVSLKIYDMFGKEVVTLFNENVARGYHVANYNASNVASGMYFYRLNVSQKGEVKFSATKKLLLLK